MNKTNKTAIRVHLSWWTNKLKWPKYKYYLDKDWGNSSKYMSKNIFCIKIFFNFFEKPSKGEVSDFSSNKARFFSILSQEICK